MTRASAFDKMVCLVLLFLINVLINTTNGFHATTYSRLKRAGELRTWGTTTSTSSIIGSSSRRFPKLPSSPRSVFLLQAEASATLTNSDTNNNNNADAPLEPNGGIIVPKTGGRGVASASQQALDRNLSLGAPPARPLGGHYLTKGGIQVTAHVEHLVFSSSTSATSTSSSGTSSSSSSSATAMEALLQKLDRHKGVLLTSSYEFPGRYSRWSLGFADPPLELSGRASNARIRALNERGRLLMPAILNAMQQLYDQGILESVQAVHDHDHENDSATATVGGASEATLPTHINVKVVPPSEVGTFSEEERSRQPSLFSVVRALVDLFSYQGGDGQLGLYGALGYDLTFQFEPIKLKQVRDPEQRDLLLYLPDEILVVDQDKQRAWTVSYDFCVNQRSTQGLPRTGSSEPFQPFDESSTTTTFEARDTPRAEFAQSVERAKREFAVGNLFEAVLSQTFREKLSPETPPSLLFRRLKARNPAPYGFFINLGEQEYLVGASPEMFVRCEVVNSNNLDDNGRSSSRLRVETCPISGTVARGADALEDAKRVKSLMMNAKEESELTMCTDVDRNDKSRICEPGSVQVIGRRQIEMYSRLIHTVDHVEGFLRPEFDALDAFLCHTWAVTVTGAPKTWAIQFVEDQERSPRCWYGGAVGMVGFDGSLNTGLTLRTVRVKNGIAEVRAGATLLYDSSPPAEELETELKASALIDAIVQKGPEDDATEPVATALKSRQVGYGKKVILIDHEDSFVHTLGNYLRQTGAEVKTLRSGPAALASIDKLIEKGEKPDMVVLSPGPGNPADFALSTSLEFLTKRRIPAFGVCLGLQGMVEHFGGTLGVLGYPMHGKPSKISLTLAGKSEDSIFKGLPDTFEVARYHSLHGLKERMPSCLEITALSEDGVVMGIRHSTLPMAAVQFHPESILTSPAHGMTILENALLVLRYNDQVNDENDTVFSPSLSGAELVGALEKWSVSELTSRLAASGLSTTGSKSELVVRLALWTHKRNEAKAGRLNLSTLSLTELRELKGSLGLATAAAVATTTTTSETAATQEELTHALEKCLLGG